MPSTSTVDESSCCGATFLSVSDNKNHTTSSLSVSTSPVSTPTSSSSVTIINNNGSVREGTLWSARLNLLSSMVGGVSLSMPMVFTQLGNVLFAPILLILVGLSIEFSIIALIKASQHSVEVPASYESVASLAFGPCSKRATMGITIVCIYLAVLGYAILLRDIAKPLADVIQPHPHQEPSMTSNLIMLCIVLLITPLCTLQSYTALKNVGLFSMIAVGILSFCVAYRSIQCNLAIDQSSDNNDDDKAFANVSLFPSDVSSFLSAMPVLISSFICHFNVIPVHNELRNPTPRRVRYLSRSTTAVAATFYLFIGIFGSFHGNCTKGQVSGNILLDFDDDDVLMTIGRICLGITISFAFPMFVIPARDIILRMFQTTRDSSLGEQQTAELELNESLLDWDGNKMSSNDADTSNTTATTRRHSFQQRFTVAIIFFWSSAALACMVTSVDIVWELLGSCLNILLGFIIPIGSFLKLCSDEESTRTKKLAWFLIVLYALGMIVFTIHASMDLF